MNIKNRVLLYLIIVILLCFGRILCQNVCAGNVMKHIGITGRTEEETDLIKRIMTEANEGLLDFLMEEWEYPHIQRWVTVWGYDFTGDGQDEIIVSKGDVNISAVLSYNYVYDGTGRKLSEFVGGDLSMTQIFNGWKEDGIFLLYDAVHYASHNNANIYTEIKEADGSMETSVQLVEFDQRPGGDEREEGYYIFRDFTKEEEIELWHGIEGINELVETKKSVHEDKTLDKYRRIFTRTERFALIGTMTYSSESGELTWIESDNDRSSYYMPTGQDTEDTVIENPYFPVQEHVSLKVHTEYYDQGSVDKTADAEIDRVKVYENGSIYRFTVFNTPILGMWFFPESGVVSMYFYVTADKIYLLMHYCQLEEGGAGGVLFHNAGRKQDQVLLCRGETRWRTGPKRIVYMGRRKRPG